MIRRPLAFRLGGYKTAALLGRNVRAWWSRRGGWIVNSLIMDELFTLRCMRALEPRQPAASSRGLRLMWRDAETLNDRKAWLPYDRRNGGGAP